MVLYATNLFARTYPGVLHDTDEWNETYKIRSVVEQGINHFKTSFCVAGRKTQNEKTLHADLLLAGITQLITVLLAGKIHQHQYIRSLKPLITQLDSHFFKIKAYLYLLYQFLLIWQLNVATNNNF